MARASEDFEKGAADGTDYALAVPSALIGKFMSKDQPSYACAVQEPKTSIKMR
jgi:hypothetical protein